VTLRFGLHAITADPAAAHRLDQLLDAIPPNALAPLWAHMSLRMTDWLGFADDGSCRWL
jgi:hypothetical protein